MAVAAGPPPDAATRGPAVGYTGGVVPSAVRLVLAALVVAGAAACPRDALVPVMDAGDLLPRGPDAGRGDAGDDDDDDDDEDGGAAPLVDGPDGALYVLTNNTDGRGDAGDDDDRLLRITPR